MRRLLSILVALVAFAAVSGAQPLQLANIFSDHAVLQRGNWIPVWGWGKPGAKVEVTGSWNGVTQKTTVEADGSWHVSLPARYCEGTDLLLTVKSGKETIERKDIALGEVWICSGQSNMEMPLRGFGFQEVEGATEAIMGAPATSRNIRVFDIKTPKCTEPIKDVEATWKYSSSEVAAETSAVGYFFAKRLQAALDVPVGIIVNAWGGSRIEPWMTKETINAAGLTQQELDEVYAIQEQPDRWPETPELIWNGRVKPIVGYAAKGIIWYQGCSNIGQRCYDKLQKAMVEMWRREWNSDLPLIFTLLAPHDHGDADGRWRPFFVENQLHTEQILDKSWAVCTETIGNKVTVHPSQKKEVADMMVQRALQNVYGVNPGFCIELPRPQSVEYVPDGSVKVRLSYVWSNLQSISARDIVGFELAGEDRQFHLAQAEVDWDGQTIVIKCPDVPKPVAVRYSWRNWMGSNLHTSYGIPVPPFRTDDWDE